jgi:hypothetical protein
LISIKTAKSPIGAGIGFIQVTRASNCDRRPSRQHNRRDSSQHPDEPHCNAKFVLLKEPRVAHAAAARLCQQRGHKLASITTASYDAAVQLVFGEGGPNASAWIGSYNGDSYGDACLALTVGQSLPGGNINEAECSSLKHVLCSRV